MEEITDVYSAWKTCLELIKDRNYSYNPIYDKITIEEFKIIYSKRLCDIISNEIEEGGEKRKIYIKFIINPKIKPSQLKEIIEELRRDYINIEDELVIVLKIKPTNTLLKIGKEKEYKNIQFMWVKQLKFNPIKHSYVPKHVRCSKEEIENITKMFNISNKLQFPIILRDDPIVKYYNFKSGEIIKIVRNSPTSGISNYYRYVK
jgi:DNA-directed RNA polymerase subunit H (RpoH/RPB5)